MSKITGSRSEGEEGRGQPAGLLLGHQGEPVLREGGQLPLRRVLAVLLGEVAHPLGQGIEVGQLGDLDRSSPRPADQVFYVIEVNKGVNVPSRSGAPLDAESTMLGRPGASVREVGQHGPQALRGRHPAQRGGRSSVGGQSDRSEGGEVASDGLQEAGGPASWLKGPISAPTADEVGPAAVAGDVFDEPGVALGVEAMRPRRPCLHLGAGSLGQGVAGLRRSSHVASGKFDQEVKKMAPVGAVTSR